MARINVDQKLLDLIAKMEIESLLDGLQSDEVRSQPAFLAKVRQFLKDNEIVVGAKTDGVESIVANAKDIPDILAGFDEENELQ